jgi:hypothetical protein
MTRTTADVAAHVMEVYGDQATLLSVEQQTLEVERMEFQLSGGPTLVMLLDPKSANELAGFLCPCCDTTTAVLPPIVLQEAKPDAN